jgi:hypothetical protein
MIDIVTRLGMVQNGDPHPDPGDDPVQAMGLSGISKSQVSKLCKDIDERVHAFLDRPLAGEWPYEAPEFPMSGGLMNYGASFLSAFGDIATYTGRILEEPGRRIFLSNRQPNSRWSLTSKPPGAWSGDSAVGPGPGRQGDRTRRRSGPPPQLMTFWLVERLQQ